MQPTQLPVRRTTDRLRGIRRATLTLSLIALVAPLSSCSSGKRDPLKAMKAGDYESAIAISVEQAESGDARSQFLAGLMHETGNGTAVDLRTAARYYRQAALQGHPAAQNNLGLMHFEGRGVDKSIAEARKWLGRSADQGFRKAQENLAVVDITSGLRAQAAKDAPKRRRTPNLDGPMTLAASGADNIAARTSGSLTPASRKGSSAKETAAWYAKAAESGSATAQHMAGLMSLQGKGAKKDPAAAVHWFRQSAEQGFAQSQFMLGYATLNGLGTRKDEAAALRLMTLAAEQGLAQAQMGLGLMHLHGQGTPANTSTAVEWLGRAADQGLPMAQHNLALVFLRSKGGADADEQGLAMLRRAAAQGHGPSMTKIGDLYQVGRGVEENPVDALAWYGIAAEHGDQLGTERRRQLAAHMTKQQLTNAQTKLEQFRRFIAN